MASRFWVGGAGTWDNATTTHWSASTGGAGGASVPATTDDVVFDASSGGGTVTVAATINGSNQLSSITMGAFTGTLDFSVNNPNLILTASFSGTGTGTRTLNMGSGTWTLTANTGAIWDFTTVTNFTFNANTSTIQLSPTTVSGGRTINGGGKTYSTLTINSPSGFTTDGPITFGGNSTIATFNVSGQNWLRFGSVTTTITNAINWNSGGSASSPILLDGGTGSTGTISSASGGTMAWAALTGITFTGGGTFTATSSLNVGGNSGITITGPSGGGGSGVIGS